MHLKLLVTGIGTDVGKTVVSAILTTALRGDYWKPIQTGADGHSDTTTLCHLLPYQGHNIYPPAYSFEAPLSPHLASALENRPICLQKVILPKTQKPLIIEGAGGILVPLDKNSLTLDLFKLWSCRWILVSKHYLGSINHTLLTLEVLNANGILPVGIIFNGEPHQGTEEIILSRCNFSFVGRLLIEKEIDRNTIKKYAQAWKKDLLKALP